MFKSHHIKLIFDFMNILIWIKYFLFKAKINRKSKLGIYEYNKIAEKHFFCDFNYVGANSTYGHSVAIKKYIDLSGRGGSSFGFVHGVIEHGLYFGNLYIEKEVEGNNLPTIFTFSEKRKNVLKKVTSKKIEVVGPYIQYVSSLYSNEYGKEIKKENGKTLLLMPSHGMRKLEPVFDVESFCDEAERIRNKLNFTTVIVCLYWMDIQRGYGALYEDKGYRVVTAGYWKDPNFLPRLRFIIDISDLLVTNSVGTFVGYSIYLNTPVYVFHQEIDYIGDKAIQFESYRGDCVDTSVCEQNYVASYFSSLEETINKNQIDIVEEYWGPFVVPSCCKGVETQSS